MENKSTFMKRQLVLIGVIVGAIAVLSVTAVLLKHFGIVDIFGGDNPKETTETNQPKYDKDGDLLGAQDRPYIYDVIPLENVSTIEIQNINPENGEKRNFSFYMDPVANNLILQGREMLSFDKEMLSYLYVNTCNMLAMAKVENPSRDLSQYGLAGGVSDNWFIVTTTSGEKKQIYIGDKFPTDAAYYCKSADKPHIYVIDTMIEQCVLVSPEDFVVPMLCPPIAQEKMHTVQDIKLISGGELKINLVAAPEGASDSSDGAAFSHVMTYPGGYAVSQDKVDSILTKLANFQGSRVVTSDLFGVYKETDNSEQDEVLKGLLEEYGLTKPSHEIHYTLDGNTYKIIFGGKTPDGSSYYAMNMTRMTICTIPVSEVAFLDYELIDFVDEYIFQMNINNLESVEVKTRKNHEVFLLSGEKSDLKVKKQSDGELIDTYSFRQFYIDVLLVAMAGKAESRDTSNEVLTYIFTTKDGIRYEYKFYDISTTKVFYTVDGKGEFYVNRDSVNKVINDFNMLLAGESFVSEAIGA